MLVTFLGGPEDGQKATPPTPVAEGACIGIPQAKGFACYQKVGGIMAYVGTYAAVEMAIDAPVASVRFHPPES